ncbi:MAG TPA: recombinase RecT [Pseudobdellovibrionaceae bacterium]|jgi:recombination protein RecT
MSNITLFEKTKSLIHAQAKKFLELAKSHKAVNFEQEASFALQALQANNFLASTAANNPNSLIDAIHNVASIGLSLNPALKHAYLVPRDGKVCLDFDYRGLAHLSYESGAVKFVQAEIVYENDRFVLRGRGQEPIHERDPFSQDRGGVRGAYTIAKTVDGDFLVETMTIAEIYAIRNNTQAYKAFLDKKTKSCPWVSHEGEMIKKTVIRRASKMWPKSNAGRFEKAMQVQDEVEMIDVTPQSKEPEKPDESPKKLEEIRQLLTAIDRSEEKYLGHLERVHKRDLKTLEDLSMAEIEQALIELYQISSKANKKPENKNEVA